MTSENEAIDLNKLSHRDLLILLHSDVKELKVGMKEVSKKQSDTELKVNTIEAKSKTESRMWSSAMGFGAGIITVIVEKFITR